MDLRNPQEMKPLRPGLFFYSGWECCTCCETQDQERPWLTRQNEKVCVRCIRHIFEQALHNEIDCPARWGPDELDAEDFSGTDYSATLHRHIIVEYQGRSARLAQQRREALRPEPLEGQKLGVDYQICPSCKTIACLADGCNHVVCTCHANFCFVCGKEAFDGSGHWGVGGCPRYNAVGSGRELYDGAGGWIDWEDDEEDEDNGWGAIEFDDQSMWSSDDAILSESEDEERAQHWLGVASFNFNVAMQTSDEQRRAMLSRFFEPEASDASAEEVHQRVVEALEIHHGDYHFEAMRPEEMPDRHHGYSELIRRVSATRSLPQYELVPELEQHLFVRAGVEVLRRPIGGLFNMAHLAARLGACTWMESVVRTSASLSPQMHFAMFSVPRGVDDFNADYFVHNLGEQVLVLQHHVFIFHLLDHGVLVQCQRRHDPESDSYASLEVGDLTAFCEMTINPASVHMDASRFPGLHRQGSIRGP